MRRIAPALALLLAAAPWLLHAQDKGEVRIYRCTDAAGKQTLRDTPCPKGQSQQARDMLRPKDAPRPARPAAALRAPAPAARATPPQVVYLAPPRPMYECTTHDGTRYASDTAEGNPRWVPLWTLGYPVVRRDTSLGGNIGGPVQRPLRPPLRDIHWPVATGGGQWIRDDCVMLPPVEACARLRDRRDQLRTRFFNAMPSERERLELEERGINARLDNDCGGR